jgi:lipocalin-like protein
MTGQFFLLRRVAPVCLGALILRAVAGRRSLCSPDPNPRGLDQMRYLILSIQLVMATSCTSGPRLAGHSGITGSWRLVSVDRVSPSGETSPEPLVDRPSGLLVLDPTGHVSLQIQRRLASPFSSGSEEQGTDEEVRAAFMSYGAYFGTYLVDVPHKGILTYKVSGSLFPNMTGRAIEREYSLQGDSLTLRSRAPQGFRVLRWVREK